MTPIVRSKIGYLLTNLNYILSKNQLGAYKTQRVLFHCSCLLQGQQIKMPSLSPTMVDGKIVKWLKKEGDVIKPGDVLCDIETDKAVVSLETEEEGILAKIIMPESKELVKVGSIIAILADEGEDWKNVDGSLNKESDSSSSSDGDSSPSTKITGTPSIPITMPSLSPTMTEGTIIKWLKKEGDAISPGDVLCEIQTDKAVMSLETEDEGILAKIIYPDNSANVSVGTIIALICEEGEDWKNVQVPLSQQAEKTSISQSASYEIKGTENSKVKTYGPAVKALLSSYQLDPGLIKSTGKGNRLLKEDVMEHIQNNRLEKKVPKVIAPPVGLTQKSSRSDQNYAQDTSSKVQTSGSPEYVDIEISNMRQVIAKRLLQSKLEIPHSYCSIKCNVANILETKSRLSTEGIKTSLNDFLMKGVAIALQLYPKANVLFMNNELKLVSNIDVCVAVATDAGLFTPIIKSCNSKSLQTISQEIRDLAARAKTGKLKPEEFMGGTFTVSNLGMFGITHFKAIINPPQCGILAVGDTIVTLDPDLKIQKHMIMSLSYDRRAMEEQEAAQFMSTLQYVIENPKLLLLDNISSSSVVL